MKLELARWRGTRSEWYWYGDQEMLSRRFYPDSGLVTWSGDDGPLKSIVDELEAARLRALEAYVVYSHGTNMVSRLGRTVTFFDDPDRQSVIELDDETRLFTSQEAAATYLFTGRLP